MTDDIQPGDAVEFDPVGHYLVHVLQPGPALRTPAHAGPRNRVKLYWADILYDRARRLADARAAVNALADVINPQAADTLRRCVDRLDGLAVVDIARLKGTIDSAGFLELYADRQHAAEWALRDVDQDIKWIERAVAGVSRNRHRLMPP